MKWDLLKKKKKRTWISFQAALQNHIKKEESGNRRVPPRGQRGESYEIFLLASTKYKKHAH